MKDSEKGKFEDAFRKAFDNAEQSPSDDVWAGVEHGLNQAETVVMRRRVVFYQRLAAASVLFALLLGGISTYYISDLMDQHKMSLSQVNSSESLSAGEVSEIDTQSTSALEDAEKSIAQDKLRVNSKEPEVKENKSGKSVIFESGNFNQSEKEALSINEFAGRQNARKNTDIQDYPSLISLIPEPGLKLNGRMKEVTIVRKLPAMPSAFMKSKNEKETGENLWASLGASTGNYSPSADIGSSSSSKVLYQNTTGSGISQSAYSTTASKGSVFSVGMNLGKRISRRWLIQSGVSYLNQSIGYTSNFAVVDASYTAMASVADYTSLKSFSSVVAVASPYQISSVNEFISVPFQAGYLLVDKKVGLQLNSGVSTDFFMQNTLTDKSGQLATYSSGSGDTSPFRAVSWAGLLGTEVSYKIAPQYRISIAPGLRYSLGSVLKSDSSPSSPLMWDVGFRFRYNIK